MLKTQAIVVNFKKRQSGFIAGLTELTQHLQHKADNLCLKHLETRSAKESESPDSHESCFLSITGEEKDLLEFCEKLKSNEHVASLQTFAPSDTKSPDYIPKHISELDQCQRVMTKSQPELETNHPGFHDEEYKKRRREIAQLAFAYPIRKQPQELMDHFTYLAICVTTDEHLIEDVTSSSNKTPAAFHGCIHLWKRWDVSLSVEGGVFNAVIRMVLINRIFSYLARHPSDGIFSGDPLPEVEYTEVEKKTWKTAYASLKSYHASRACAEYIEGFRLLEECGVFCPDEIPQMKAVSKVLERTSGFRLRPTSGLVTPHDFLANFAFRVFPCSQYIRHHSQPQYTPEPDLIHEFIGHVPLLTNRKYADFVQQIGLYSLGATEEEVKKLATMFWFTIEFGLCLENSEQKAFGAGVLSSYGELENAFSETSEKRPFDPEHAAIEPYSDVKYQAVYFVCDSLERLRKQFFAYVKSHEVDKWPHYDPYTQTVSFETAEGVRKLMLTDIEEKLERITLLDLY